MVFGLLFVMDIFNVFLLMLDGNVEFFGKYLGNVLLISVGGLVLGLCMVMLLFEDGGWYVEILV